MRALFLRRQTHVQIWLAVPLRISSLIPPFITVTLQYRLIRTKTQIDTKYASFCKGLKLDYE